MRGTLYKLLGFLVWKGFVADIRRRGRVAAKRAGAVVLLATVGAAIWGAIVVAQGRHGGAD